MKSNQTQTNKTKSNATQSNTKVVETLGPLTPFDRNHDSPIHWFHWSVATNNKKARSIESIPFEEISTQNEKQSNRRIPKIISPSEKQRDRSGSHEYPNRAAVQISAKREQRTAFRASRSADVNTTASRVVFVFFFFGSARTSAAFLYGIRSYDRGEEN